MKVWMKTQKTPTLPRPKTWKIDIGDLSTWKKRKNGALASRPLTLKPNRTRGALGSKRVASFGLMPACGSKLVGHSTSTGMPISRAQIAGCSLTHFPMLVVLSSLPRKEGIRFYRDVSIPFEEAKLSLVHGIANAHTQAPTDGYTKCIRIFIILNQQLAFSFSHKRKGKFRC